MMCQAQPGLHWENKWLGPSIIARDVDLIDHSCALHSLLLNSHIRESSILQQYDSYVRIVRRGLIRATLHLVNREFDALADDFMTLGLLPPGSDKATIVPALTGVFQVLPCHPSGDLRVLNHITLEPRHSTAATQVLTR